MRLRAPSLVPVYLTVAGLSLFLFLCGLRGYPPPMPDAVAFVPAAISFHQGEGLTNPVVNHPALRGTGGRYTYHAPLFPIVIGVLMFRSTPEAAFLAIAVLRIMLLLLFTVFLLELMRRTGARREPSARWLICCTLIASCAYGMPNEGRPEAVSALLIMLGALAGLYLRWESLWPVWGVILGLIAATHPIGAAAGVAAAGIYYSVRTRAPGVGWHLLGVTLTGVVAGALVLHFTPYGLEESLSGMIRFSGAAVWGGGWDSGTWRLLIAAGPRAFAGPVIVLSLVAGWRLFRIHVGKIPSRITFVLCALAFLGVGWFFSVRVPTRMYNLLQWTPLMLSLVVVWATGRSWGVAPGWTTPVWAKGLALAIVIGAASGLLRYLALFPLFETYGVPLGEARTHYAESIDVGGKRVLAGEFLWSLSERYQNMKSPIGDEEDLAATDLVVIPKAAAAWARWLPDHGFVLRDQIPGRRAPAIGGLIPGWVSGYAFEVYERIRPDPRAAGSR